MTTASTRARWWSDDATAGHNILWSTRGQISSILQGRQHGRGRRIPPRQPACQAARTRLLRMRSGLSGDTPAAAAVRLAVAGSRASGRSQPTGTIHWYRTTTAAATGPRPRKGCSQAGTGPTHQDERSKGHTLNGETEETGSEANEWEIKPVGEVDTDGRIERKNDGRWCDQTRRLITPTAPVRSHLSRRRWGRLPV